MVAIVPNVPESVGSIGATSTKLEGPEIVVVGKYLKRLAYQSGVGADPAPVVVGQITKAPISEDELARRSNAEVPEPVPLDLVADPPRLSARGCLGGSRDVAQCSCRESSQRTSSITPRAARCILARLESSRSTSPLFQRGSVMSQRRTFARRAFIGLAILVALVTPQVTPADSAIPLLSGFDRERIDSVYPPTDEASLGELAKLVYRLRSLDPSTLKGLADRRERDRPSVTSSTRTVALKRSSRCQYQASLWSSSSLRD